VKNRPTVHQSTWTSLNYENSYSHIKGEGGSRGVIIPEQAQMSGNVESRNGKILVTSE